LPLPRYAAVKASSFAVQSRGAAGFVFHGELQRARTRSPSQLIRKVLSPVQSGAQDIPKEFSRQRNS
jgi:hypothetical protein